MCLPIEKKVPRFWNSQDLTLPRDAESTAEKDLAEVESSTPSDRSWEGVIFFILPESQSLTWNRKMAPG